MGMVIMEKQRVAIRIFEYFRGRIFESTFIQRIPALPSTVMEVLAQMAELFIQAGQNIASAFGC